jgi:hypothetical protein
MPVIGPIVGAAIRAAASRAGGTASATQFGRAASVLPKVGRIASTVGRRAILMSAFKGVSSALPSLGQGSMPSTGEPTKKQGLDTYEDGIY